MTDLCSEEDEPEQQREARGVFCAFIGAPSFVSHFVSVSRLPQACPYSYHSIEGHVYFANEGGFVPVHLREFVPQLATEDIVALQAAYNEREGLPPPPPRPQPEPPSPDTQRRYDEEDNLRMQREGDWRVVVGSYDDEQLAGSVAAASQQALGGDGMGNDAAAAVDGVSPPFDEEEWEASGWDDAQRGFQYGTHEAGGGWGDAGGAAAMQGGWRLAAPAQHGQGKGAWDQAEWERNVWPTLQQHEGGASFQGAAGGYSGAAPSPAQRGVASQHAGASQEEGVWGATPAHSFGGAMPPAQHPRRSHSSPPTGDAQTQPRSAIGTGSAHGAWGGWASATPAGGARGLTSGRGVSTSLFASLQQQKPTPPLQPLQQYRGAAPMPGVSGLTGLRFSSHGTRQTATGDDPFSSPRPGQVTSAAGSGGGGRLGGQQHRPVVGSPTPPLPEQRRQQQREQPETMYGGVAAGDDDFGEEHQQPPTGLGFEVRCATRCACLWLHFALLYCAAGLA